MGTNRQLIRQDLQAKKDPVLYGAMAKVIIDHGLMNLPFIKRHCRDYDKFIATVLNYDLLEAAALAYARARYASIPYSTGLEYEDTDSIKSIVNLCLLSGQI